MKLANTKIQQILARLACMTLKI